MVHKIQCPSNWCIIGDNKGFALIFTLVPHRVLARSLGEAGEIEPETDGMLTAYGFDFEEFPQEVCINRLINSLWLSDAI